MYDVWFWPVCVYWEMTVLLVLCLTALKGHTNLL